MSSLQVPEGTVVHRAWMVRGEVNGVAQRWGAVVMTVPGADRDRCHFCWDEPGHGLRASRTRGAALKLIESAQTRALKRSAVLGDVPIRRYDGGSLRQFHEWFRGTEEPDIPTPPGDESLAVLPEISA